jgi:hypothetical protein
MRGAWRTSAVILAAAATLSASRVIAENVPLDREIKATFLYKFAPFVAWPEAAFTSPNSPLSICILADSTLADSLRPAVAGQHEGSHPIAVRGVKSTEPDCQIVYVPGQDTRSTGAVLGTLKGRPVLTVTDVPLEATDHGMITFTMDHGHVRFDIDDAAAARSGLTISSKLLELARVVKPREASP